VRLVLFETLLFPGVLEEVVLLLAEGRGSSRSFEVYSARDAASLTGIDIAPWRGFTPAGDEKWTHALLPETARDLYRDLTLGGHFGRLLDWGETYLGAVTGNNDFFCLAEPDVARLGLHADVLRISPPGARHLRGPRFGGPAWRQLARDGGRCFLFYPREAPGAAARAYIEAGAAVGVDRAYKCQVRAPWWRVPLVGRPDLLFAYMNHDRPRLTANAAGVHVLNSLYGVRLAPGLRELGRSGLPLACLNTLTLLGSEVVGRAYGGGLLKHEPKEADLLPVPGAALLQAALPELRRLEPRIAAALRRNRLLEAVELVDAVILARHLQLDPGQLAHLRQAREALFRRRVARGRGNSGEDR
jgi:hypothetical protein